MWNTRWLSVRRSGAAIQPPSVASLKLPGQVPQPQPAAKSCSETRGPGAPAWMRAARETLLNLDNVPRALRSIETLLA